MQEKIYSTPCGEIHYWVNELQKPSLVFLPGLSANHKLFDKQIEYFNGDYHILVWDAPGHSASRPFQLNFSLIDKAKWLHDILEKEQMKNFVIIGQSMGGYVAQCFMEKYPDLVKGFVSIDSAPMKRKFYSSFELAFMKNCEWMYRAYPWKILINAGSKACAQTSYGRTLMREMMLEYQKLDYCRLVAYGYKMLAEAIEMDLNYDISCPTLLICGKQDKAAATAKYNREWARIENLPISWIDGAGHNSNTDCPDEVNKEIQKWLGVLSF